MLVPAARITPGARKEVVGGRWRLRMVSSGWTTTPISLDPTAAVPPPQRSSRLSRVCVLWFCRGVHPPHADGAQYSLVAGATCASGFSPITSSWQDCRQAAIALGLTGDAINHVDYRVAGNAAFPEGCYRDGGNDRVHFNPGVGGVGNFNDRIICQRAGKRGFIPPFSTALPSTPTAAPH